jgi:hypothetical protein
LNWRTRAVAVAACCLAGTALAEPPKGFDARVEQIDFSFDFQDLDFRPVAGK